MSSLKQESHSLLELKKERKIYDKKILKAKNVEVSNLKGICTYSTN